MANFFTRRIFRVKTSTYEAFREVEKLGAQGIEARFYQCLRTRKIIVAIN